jgi:hypothetical protein
MSKTFRGGWREGQKREKALPGPALRADLFHCVHPHPFEPSRFGARHVEHLGFADLDCSGAQGLSEAGPRSREALSWGVDTFVNVHST